MDYYIDETMGLTLFSTILDRLGDLELPMTEDFLTLLKRLETICTCDVFMVVKNDEKWLDKGWNVGEVYRSIEELKRKTSQELIPLFLNSGDKQRLSLAFNVTSLLTTLDNFTKNAVLDNYANGSPN